MWWPILITNFNNNENANNWILFILCMSIYYMSLWHDSQPVLQIKIKRKNWHTLASPKAWDFQTHPIKHQRAAVYYIFSCAVAKIQRFLPIFYRMRERRRCTLSWKLRSMWRDPRLLAVRADDFKDVVCVKTVSRIFTRDLAILTRH